MLRNALGAAAIRIMRCLAYATQQSIIVKCHQIQALRFFKLHH